MKNFKIGMLVLVPRFPLSLYAPPRVGDWWDVGIIKTCLEDGICLIYTHDTEDLEIHEDFLRPLV